MVQAPHAPPLIPEATNRKTVGTVEGVVPVNTAAGVDQVTEPRTGPGKRRRPPVTVAANVVEGPVVVPKAARPCRETRRVGRSRVGAPPSPWRRMDRRARQSTSCDAETTQEGLKCRPLPIRGYMPTRRA